MCNNNNAYELKLMIKGDQLPITIVLKYFYDVNRFYFVAVAVKFDKKPSKPLKTILFLYRKKVLILTINTIFFR